LYTGGLPTWHDKHGVFAWAPFSAKGWSMGEAGFHAMVLWQS
jgi:hypothetical protein